MKQRTLVEHDDLDRDAWNNVIAATAAIAAAFSLYSSIGLPHCDAREGAWSSVSDIDFAQMMQLMHSDPAAGRQLLAESLRARAETDPRMSLMLEMMQPAVPPISSGRSRSQRVRAAIQEMREELVELYERNETLADALGACAICWGRVKHCSECRGRGRPGWRTPEPDLFEEFVAPAITKRGEP